MRKVIIDTNFLLIPYQFKVDIFSEIRRICNVKYDVFVLDKTVGELERIIGKQGGKHREAAKLALGLLKSKGVKVIETREDKVVDDIIVELANRKEHIVATQDKGLKRRLKTKGIPVITLRQRQYLVLRGV
jgi:hypothetical protein